MLPSPALDINPSRGISGRGRDEAKDTGWEGEMSAKLLRPLALLAVLAIDFAALTAISFHLFHPSANAWASEDTSLTNPQQPSAATASGSAPAMPALGASSYTLAPRRPIGADAPLPGTPKFITSGVADHNGGTWLGTEGQGIWAYRHHAWQQFSVAHGLADDGVCSVACDALGRIWAGHEAHGVSIYNGQQWRNYDRFDGPGGSHVFAIATSPADGDVWLATENGLARYSLKNDSWSRFDRSNGFPAAQATAIAIDHAENVFVALPDAGIAWASSSDGYAHWTTTTGPDDISAQPSGQGLPSPIVTALLVTHADVLYAGTTRGLARSSDHGVTWSYVRGANWAQMVRGSYSGGPADFNPQGGSPLREDWITALAEDPSGELWVGYHTAGFQVFAGDSNAPLHVGKGRVTALVPLPNGAYVIGDGEDGATAGGTGDDPTPPAAPPSFTSALSADVFPSNAKPLSADSLDTLRQKVEALAPGAPGVEYLTDDWETIGDWPGHIGAALADPAGYDIFRSADGYQDDLVTGPYRDALVRTDRSNDANLVQERGLLDPNRKRRIFTEQNDESYSKARHPITEEGPDLYVKLAIPPGVHRVSLYFYNFDGHKPTRNLREYPIQIRQTEGSSAATPEATDAQNNPILESADRSGGQLSSSETIEAELAPILCRSYVPRYWYGVYKQLLIRGGGTYWIKIVRNYSAPCKIQGVFVDRLDAPSPAATNYSAPWPAPPAIPDVASANGTVQAAAKLWTSLDAAVGRDGYAAMDIPYRTLAYQAAAANGADADLLTNWRWQLAAWTKQDRERFNAAFNLKNAH